jgi:hypothetical protein
MGGLLKCPFRDFTWIAIAHATVHQSLPECTVTLLLVGTIVPRHAAITSDLVVRDKPITNTQAKPEMGNFREVFFRSILCGLKPGALITVIATNSNSHDVAFASLLNGAARSATEVEARLAAPGRPRG